MSDVGRPTSLRAFLDAGGDPTTLDGWSSILDDAHDALLEPPAARAERVATARHWADLDERPDGLGDEGRKWTEVRAAFRYTVELLEDPALARRFLDALPERERVAAWELLDKKRRPYPLTIGPRDQPGRWWQCQNCGEGHAEEEDVPHVVISGREGWSDIDDLTYCAGCITIVAQLVGGLPIDG